MIKTLNFIVLIPLLLLILGNAYINSESQAVISMPSGNLATPIPTATLTNDQQSFASPVLLVPFIALPVAVLGICGMMLLLVVVFILGHRAKGGKNG